MPVVDGLKAHTLRAEGWHLLVRRCLVHSDEPHHGFPVLQQLLRRELQMLRVEEDLRLVQAAARCVLPHGSLHASLPGHAPGE